MRRGRALFAAAAIVAATLPFLRDQDDTLHSLLSRAQLAVSSPAKKTAPKHKVVDPPALTGIELQYLDDRRDIITAPAYGKRNAELTVDPIYQRAATTFLRHGQVYDGSVVMTDIRTGRVLVWASFNHGRPRDLPSQATAPSASVFKIVTASALFEQGVSLSEKFCYRGGRSGITERELEPNEKRDKWCVTLGRALGRSINTVFARLASQNLDQQKLASAAHRLGWDMDIPFDVPIQKSKLEIPDERLEFARTAAGFWNTTLSPFQAANLAQTIANNGEMIRSYLVERVVDENGEEIYRRPHQRQVFKRVLNERTAWAVARMMEQTVADGSSFKTFHDRAGRPFLPNIRVAAKTGTLQTKKTGTLHTWWVGFAPADKPEVALSVLINNRGPWRVKGAHVASNMLRVYFADKKRKGVRYPPGFSAKPRGESPPPTAAPVSPSDTKKEALKPTAPAAEAS